MFSISTKIFFDMLLVQTHYVLFLALWELGRLIGFLKELVAGVEDSLLERKSLFVSPLLDLYHLSFRQWFSFHL
jgi:hypothetical protein